MLDGSILAAVSVLDVQGKGVAEKKLGAVMVRVAVRSRPAGFHPHVDTPVPAPPPPRRITPCALGDEEDGKQKGISLLDPPGDARRGERLFGRATCHGIGGRGGSTIARICGLN